MLGKRSNSDAKGRFEEEKQEHIVNVFNMNPRHYIYNLDTLEINPNIVVSYHEGAMREIAQRPETWGVLAFETVVNLQPYLDRIFERGDLRALAVLGCKTHISFQGPNFMLETELLARMFHHEDWDFPRQASLRERIPSKEKFCYCTLDELFERLEKVRRSDSAEFYAEIKKLTPELHLKITGAKEFRVRWSFLPLELKSITIERVSALEFGPYRYQLLELNLTNVSLYGADEMMSAVSVENLSFSNCFFIVQAGRMECFGLNDSSNEKIKSVKLLNCKINGQSLSYRDIHVFLAQTFTYKRPGRCLIGDLTKWRESTSGLYCGMMDELSMDKFMQALPQTDPPVTQALRGMPRNLQHLSVTDIQCKAEENLLDFLGIFYYFKGSMHLEEARICPHNYDLAAFTALAKSATYGATFKVGKLRFPWEQGDLSTPEDFKKTMASDDFGVEVLLSDDTAELKLRGQAKHMIKVVYSEKVFAGQDDLLRPG